MPNAGDRVASDEHPIAKVSDSHPPKRVHSARTLADRFEVRSQATEQRSDLPHIAFLRCR
jgi:hypothetical protein